MAVSLWKQQFTQFKDSSKSLNEVLLSGELAVNDYMKWAIEHYKLPFLNDNFFAQTNNHKLLVSNPSPQWSEFYFPIHEWQGMLYIGCLEPQTLTMERKTCQVLCSPKQLSLLWAKMEKPGAQAPVIAPAPTAVAPPAAKPVPPAPAAVKPATPQPVATPPVATKPAAVPPPVAVQKPVPPVAPPAPAPSASVQKLNTGTPAASAPPIPLGKFRLEETKSETDVRLKIEATPTPTTTPTEVSTTVKPAHEEPTVVPMSHLKNQGVTVNPNLKESNFNVPEITNVVRSTPPKNAGDNFTATKTIMPFPDRTTQFTFIRTVYSEQVIVEARAKIQENMDPQDALISAFRILKDYYKKLMWIVRDQKGHAFPIACNSEWEFTEEAWNLAMDFKTPNPFRIAKLTQKPFHGTIHPNHASNTFFKQWGDGTYPDVFSVYPVKLHGKVFGYFVGCGKGQHFQEAQSIELMESVCKDLIEAFIKIHKELAKAS